MHCGDMQPPAGAPLFQGLCAGVCAATCTHTKPHQRQRAHLPAATGRCAQQAPLRRARPSHQTLEPWDPHAGEARVWEQEFLHVNGEVDAVQTTDHMLSSETYITVSECVYEPWEALGNLGREFGRPRSR